MVDHQQEAEDRWGHTQAFRQSAQRTADYGPADWNRIEDEAAGIYRAFVNAMADGLSPDHPELRPLVVRHREHISRWFYDCTEDIHRGLGLLYAEDPRFGETLDAHGPGLAAFLSTAILATAASESD